MVKLSLTGIFLSIVFLPLFSLSAEQVQFPASGIYNGFLNQLNIVECDNNNTESVSGELSLFNSAGSTVGNQSFTLDPSGSAHIILNDLASIADSYGTYSVSLSGDQVLSERVSCRTVFYLSLIHI